ncbi:MAG: CRISPR-associated helicase Cas3' [Lachnospiraceae bacterium]|nr:CRISPR-associated helicase Cas3' [Lachnospiraceae bacterium]MDE6981341.1 CRISPR-associated helicase Cas3' [Lachnospiraceae bacterium]
MVKAHIAEDGSGREESVEEHTKKTAYLCREKGKRLRLPQVMSLCGILHDMGKNKQKFEDYISSDEREKRRLRGSIPHASTGAKYIYDMCHDKGGNVQILTEMISYAVAAHHGMFDCVDAEQRDVFLKKVSQVEDYEEAQKNALKGYLFQYETEKIFEEALQEFALVWDRLNGVLKKLKPEFLKRENPREAFSDCSFFLFSCLQRLLLSVLIDADWEATADFMSDVDTLEKQVYVDAGEVFREALCNYKEYMKNLGDSINSACLTEKEKEILSGRNMLKEECREFAKYPAGIYCLPIPTGGGKTLSGLAYGLEYARNNPDTERIIYVSPYISITEQNAKVFREAVGREAWVLEHHSSVVRGRKKEDEDYRSSRFSRLEINWESPFICTTFVQFMNTLFSHKSESVRRMHRLANSVVIIDEVQSVPLKCIHTFNYMMNFLHAVCHTNVILCTATQPALEAAERPVCYSQPKYMISNARRWFTVFDRVNIHIPQRGEKYTLESLGDEIAGQALKYPSILVILNTKSAVGKLYDILKEKNIDAEYLTTNLCAQHRSDKIDGIKKKLHKGRESLVVVSTNLIEAGVDISFACVYRSMAGLDSLAQSAGRCNRNGEMEYGTLHVITLEGENTGNMRELLQSRDVTEEVFYEYQKSPRQDSLLMPRWMDLYYKKLYAKASDEMDFPIKNLDTSIMELLSRGFGLAEKRNVMNQAYKTAGQAYQVIDDNSFGVIVPYKKGAEIIERIQEASDFAEIKECIRSAQRYTVSVRQNLLEKYQGLIQPVSEKTPELYTIAAPGAYSQEKGITGEWEPLIF